MSNAQNAKPAAVATPPQYSEVPWGSDATLSSDFDFIRCISDANGNQIAKVRHNVDQTQDEALTNARIMQLAPQLLEALEKTVVPLMRLGDFVGNVDHGGASGLGSFDRCAILLEVRQLIAQAKGDKYHRLIR